MRLSTQGDFGVPARTLADGRFSTPVAFAVSRMAHAFFPGEVRELIFSCTFALNSYGGVVVPD